ncbi:MAG: COX15/CtaA family protein [Acidimicrobiales bacterium]|nr:COX15/CtaA family protein [Acidimicrobiales bacterium]
MHRLRARLIALARDPVSPGAYRVVAAVALIALGAIVVSGAAVRLTGSGMGCPTWPTCENGSIVPRGATGGHGWVEFLNRVFTGAVSLAVAVAVLASRRRQPRRADLTALSWGLVAGVFAQALLGGLVVILHVAPIAVAGHYLLSAVLVADGVVLLHRAGLPDGPRRAAATPALLRWSRGLVALGGLVLVTGTLVTGSGPHGGDEAADRLPFAVRTVVPLHSGAVWAFLVVAMVVLYRAERGDVAPDALGRGRVLIGAITAQGGLGYLQYFTGVPEGLVGLHVLGSVLVWVAVLRFHLGLSEPTASRPVPDARPPVAVAVA